MSLFGDRIPETRVARIEGTAAFALRVSLPDGALALKPDIEGFTVDGLGTTALAGRMPRIVCGDEPVVPSARRDARGFGRWLPLAVVAAEDQRYAEHPGYDLKGLGVALSRNAASMTVERGASTIPQQLARMLYVGGERSTSRKLRELLYAVEMERTLGKARMLNLYLAVAPWGTGICGARSAAAFYFHADVAKLDAAQAVWLAAMLHAPDREAAQWQARGGIDFARSKRVANAMVKTMPSERTRLLADLRALAAPLPAESIDDDRSVPTVIAQDARIC